MTPSPHFFKPTAVIVTFSPEDEAVVVASIGPTPDCLTKALWAEERYAAEQAYMASNGPLSDHPYSASVPMPPGFDPRAMVVQPPEINATWKPLERGFGIHMEIEIAGASYMNDECDPDCRIVLEWSEPFACEPSDLDDRRVELVLLPTTAEVIALVGFDDPRRELAALSAPQIPVERAHG